MNKNLKNWVVKTAVGGSQQSDFFGSTETVNQDVEFFEYLKHGGGLLNYLLERARYAPLNVRTATPSAAITANVVQESKPIPVSSYSMSLGTLEPTKAAGIAIASNETLKADPRGAEWVLSDLRQALTLSCDTRALAILKAFATPAGGGASFAADMGTLLTAVCKSAVGDLALVCSPARAAKICSLVDTAGGAPLYPDLSPAGGVAHGINVIVSAGQSDTELTLVDINGLVGNDQGVEVVLAKNGMIEMADDATGASDTPVAASKSMISLFQADATAFRGTRHFGLKPVRANCVHVLTSISW